MSQLRSDILRKRKKSEIEKSEKLYKRNHIATPIQPYETADVSDVSEASDEEDNNSEMVDDDVTVGDEEETQFQGEPDLKDNEDDIIDLTEQWVRVIQNWMGMVGEEHFSDSDEVNLSAFIAVDRTIHPADDPLAKWRLSSIFNNRFESPDFVNVLTNLG
jgi:hypothetical protein